MFFSLKVMSKKSHRAGRVSSSSLIITSLMLFSMFFGTGNLIFPPLLGQDAGTNLWPAIVGFLCSGVALPALGVIAIAVSGHSVKDLSNRVGPVFGVVFPILAYLSIGTFYALPRTGAVSFATAITPLTGWDSAWASAAFNGIFFAVTLALCWNPNGVSDALGKFLTPALVVLLVILVTVALVNFPGTEGVPTEKYATAPFAAGLLEGYLTMDSIAGLAFGIVVITALRGRGATGGEVVRGTVRSALVGGGLLAAVYVGLGLIGSKMPDGSQFEDGADLLTSAARMAIGVGGQAVFSLIVLLACLTTSVGLTAATSEFFNTLWPRISYHTWCVCFSLLSFGLATQGLETVLKVAAPVVAFIYPPAIVLILMTIVEALVRRHAVFHWLFVLPIWVTVGCSALETLADFHVGGTVLSRAIGWVPLYGQGLGWVAPALLLGVVPGLVGDIWEAKHRPERVAERRRRRDAALLGADGDTVAVESMDMVADADVMVSAGVAVPSSPVVANASVGEDVSQPLPSR